VPLQLSSTPLQVSVVGNTRCVQVVTLPKASHAEICPTLHAVPATVPETVQRCPTLHCRLQTPPEKMSPSQH
jgi:hypothetical protein